MTLRKCSKCDAEKPVSAFWKQARHRDGVQSACISCMTESHKLWRNGLSIKRRTELSKRNMKIVNFGRKRDPLAQMYRSIKSRAKKDGKEFDLKVEDIVIPEFCPVLGIRIFFEVARGYGLKEKDQRPSVDRIDNNKGYTRDNIVVVSYRANRIKSDATAAELEMIANFYRERADGRPDGLRDISQVERVRPAQDNMPAVQPHKKKKNGSMSGCEAGNRRVCVLLPSLRPQRRIVF